MNGETKTTPKRKRILAAHREYIMGRDKDKDKIIKLVPASDGLTSKQETFAKLVSEGQTLTDAYRSAYSAEKMKDSSVWVEACKLRQHPKVSQRIEALSGEITARQASEDERLRIFVTEQLKHEALGAGSDSARVQALVALGRSVAMFSDKVIEEDSTHRTASEIEAEIQDRLSRLLGS